MQQKQLTIRMNTDLYYAAQQKCNEEFAIGLSSLIKVFLKAFVTQEGVGFFIGNQDLNKLFHRWLLKKKFDRSWRPNSSPIRYPKLEELYRA